jgi:hypothetical protein
MEKVSDTASGRSSLAPRRAVPWAARVCVLVGAIVCGGLAGPGAARAADSFGIDGLSEQIEAAAVSEVNSALAAPVGGSAGGQAIEGAAQQIAKSIPSAASGSAAPAAGASTAPIASSAKSADAAPASSPISFMSSELESPPVAPLEAALQGSERVAAKPSGRLEKPHSTARAAARTSAAVTRVSLGSSTTVESSIHASAWSSVRTRSVISTGSSSRTRSTGARDKHPAPSGATWPPPLPPAPLPPRPDLSSAGQNGGQGLLLPLVMAAIAAVLAIFCFEFLPRLLPRMAFRRPRRIAIPPWRPG